MPHRSSVPMHWRLRKGKYSLVGSECADCGGRQFPRRLVCPSCGSQNLKALGFSGFGTIESHTTIHAAPAGFRPPYGVAVVRLDEGPMVVAGLADGGVAEVGSRVRAVFRKQAEEGDGGLILYGIKFEIVERNR